MPTLIFQTTVPAPLEKVWAFHDDPYGALPVLTPPQADVRVESADVPIGAGSRVVLRVRDPFGRRRRWVARYAEHRPPHPVAFGEEARFVDEQESGPFAFWRHEHEFERVDDRTTLLTDRVT